MSSFTPGQQIVCTITKAPRAAAAQKTIARLMRQDADNNRGLRVGQRRRRKANNPYIRGNRLWVARVKASKVVRVTNDESWSMTYTPLLAADLASVESYLDIRPA
ncbi:MAG: hypothetical protein AAF108_09530 [Planctomycetota bacterium]